MVDIAVELVERMLDPAAGLDAVVLAEVSGYVGRVDLVVRKAILQFG